MWKLKAPSSELITWYKRTMLDGLCSRIKKFNNGVPVLELDVQNILIPQKDDGTDDKTILEQLLICKPIELHALCDELMKQIIPDYNENEFPLYLEAKNRRNYRDTVQEDLFQKYFGTLKKLLDVFDYDGQLSRNKSRSYKLSLEQGHNTCTYCNRQYVITVNGKNDNQRIARPQLDHWFSKEIYPLMSLNIYNLIPCCSICNSSIKGNTLFSLDTHVHPYLDSTPEEPDFQFNYKLEKDLTYSVICVNIAGIKEQNMLKAFEIEKLYEYHGELEVKDILLFLKKNPNSYLSHLLNDTLKEYGYTEYDVYRMFFGTELDSTNNPNRPFSKLKRDILTQLGVLKSGHFKI